MAQSDAKSVAELVTRYSMIKICGIYGWVSEDPSSEAMLEALDLQIRAQKAQMDPTGFIAALDASRDITGARTDNGRNGQAYTTANCSAILQDEAAAFRNER
ncbi:hypothetical protein [Pacificibacter maritimus]|uniref:hypothetical protein n=1 Tax=Pacificibacter maritimus TaxID=762213 RepID=UPI00147514C3|nr:hypothetical protein [Pacificibacter maritimus]